MKQKKELTDAYKIWNKKLKDSGFVDIETHPYKVIKQEIVHNELYECHFEACWQWFHKNQRQFRTEMHALAFELYCWGKSSHEIEIELTQRFGNSYSSRWVRHFIKKCLNDGNIDPVEFR